MSQNDIETNAENYEMEDGPFRKEHDITSEKLAKKLPDIDINEHNVLNKDIESLKFPAVIKKALKTLKALLNLITIFK